LSPLAGVRVSPIQFGAMSIGDKWSDLGSMDKERSFELLDTYFDLGVRQSNLSISCRLLKPSRHLVIDNRETSSTLRALSTP
jgi:hypothetical protein